MTNFNNFSKCLNKTTNEYCGEKLCINNNCTWFNLTCCYNDSCNNNICTIPTTSFDPLILIGIILIILICIIAIFITHFRKDTSDNDNNKYMYHFSFEQHLMPLY